MDKNHEEMQRALPGYIARGVRSDDVENHLLECDQCKSESAVLKALQDIPVPEPRRLFYETLPGKIRTSLGGREKRFFSRLVPAFAILLLVITAGYVLQTIRSFEATDTLYSYSDPLDHHEYEVAGLEEGDFVTAEFSEEESVYLFEDTAYVQDIALLTADEFEGLTEDLLILNNNGGA